MHWLYLFLAAVCEIVWAVGLKYTHGFTRLWPTVFTVVVMILSFVLLAKAVRVLPLGTAYAIWTGIGAAGTVVLGIALFNEPRDAMRLLFLGMIIAGVVGLKWATPA